MVAIIAYKRHPPTGMCYKYSTLRRGNMLALIVCLLPLAFAAPSQHIIGGTPVSDPGRHPWQGSLQFFGGHTCGCVLLTADYVLTAAHCTDGRDNNPSNFQMRFNSVFWANGGDQYTVSVITGHPDYDDGTGGFIPHDVCVLTSADSITGTGVAIDSNQFENDCWISGWGVDTTGGGSVTAQLNEADMNIMPNAQCAATWGTSFRADLHICVVDENNAQGSCNGDSGGPLVCNLANGPELRGVTSWGINGCYTAFPSVYARLYNTGSGDNLKPWICANAPGAQGC